MLLTKCIFIAVRGGERFWSNPYNQIPCPAREVLKQRRLRSTSTSSGGIGDVLFINLPPVQERCASLLAINSEQKVTTTKKIRCHSVQNTCVRTWRSSHSRLTSRKLAGHLFQAFRFHDQFPFLCSKTKMSSKSLRFREAPATRHQLYYAILEVGDVQSATCMSSAR